MKLKLLIIFSCLFSISTTAQIYFSEATSIDITQNGRKIQDPFTGGYNNAQFSEIDLNLDGILDLVVFDRFKGLVRPYINKGIQDSIHYTYAPEYAEQFPEMDEILITRDYNNDGKMDLYVAGNEINLYENTSKPGQGLSFQIVSKLQSKNNPTQSFIGPINPGSLNFPAIIDIDGDNDMDIIYRSGSRTLDYHRNYSIDRNNDFVPIYERRSPCWGNVSFGFGMSSFQMDSILLNNCRGLVRGERWNRDKHAEAMTTTAIDIDQNSSIDVLTSDIGSYQMRMLLNADSSITTSKINSSIFKVLDSFPNYDTPIDILFATAYFIDVDNDGKKDMIASSSHKNNSPAAPYADEEIWLYENIANGSDYKFHLITKSFLRDQTLDFGRNAKPVFIDYNKDGLQDLLVGNGGRLQKNDSTLFIESLALLVNTGTKNSPSFELIDTNYLQLDSKVFSFPRSTFSSATPTIGDIDGDGDEDILLTQYDQRVYWFEDTASAGNVAAFKFHSEPYQKLKELDATTLFDVDKNGTLDLVGVFFNRISYFTNFGSPVAPLYSIKLDSFIWIGGDTMRYFIKTPPNYSFFTIGDTLAVDQAVNPNNNSRISLILQQIDTVNHFFDCINTISGGVGSNIYDEPTTTAIINFQNRTWNLYRLNNLSGLNEQAVVDNVFLFNDKTLTNLYAGGSSGLNTSYMVSPFSDTTLPHFRNDNTPKVNMANYGENIFIDGTDLNGDSIVDLAIGLATGGIKILYGSRVNSLKEFSNNGNKKTNLLQLYPNPTNGLLNIELKVETNTRSNLIEVRNISGKLILTDQFTGSFKTMDLGQLSNGIYFITVRNELEIYSEKLILRP